ncbi:MAG: hypothetical protein ACLU7E_13645 [Clostridium butyricum]
MVFLDINRIELVCSDEGIIDFGLEVVSGKYGTKYVKECIFTLVINMDEFNWWISKVVLHLHHKTYENHFIGF